MSTTPEPIAIVGIGCRLPGGADNPDDLWTLLRDGVDAITPIPQDRFAEDLYDERPATPGRIMSRWGGFVDDLAGFDAAFFETSPREAERLDPQQRLLLETACEALDDAGIARAKLAGSNAGVYVGMWLNEYEARMFADTDQIDFHMTTGTGRYAASGRLSYFLDLLGPSITIDTACSSSLVAIHLACEALTRGECNVALAGGANAIIEPFITVAYSQSKMMAPDGHCKFGDAAANGYVRSDGAVMLSLKRLSDAQADGDRIYAVIRGSAVTNDGRSSGFLATPGQAGQENMLRCAYERAGVDPATVQYIEAHGTGTAAGDPVEVGAIGAVLGRPAGTHPCLVGSIKSNIGHTEGAAGAAGLAKLALALHHREIPASLHVEQPNPDISWNELGIRIVAERQPWPTVDGARRGGVSAFGIAGTNAHIVLEEAPTADDTTNPAAIGASSPFVLPISTFGVAALSPLAERYATALDQNVDSLHEFCATAATRRDHLDDRLAVVGSTAAELSAEFRRRAGAVVDHPQPSTAGRRVVFVFSGQGSQWTGMQRELLADEPVYAAAMAECDRSIRVEAGWSPIEMLSASETSERIDDIDVVQPLLFAVQVSLAALWKSWGITPAAVVGHSMGEAAAAYVAGALDLDDAVAVICRRSTLLRRIAGHGAMGLVDLSIDDARTAIAGREADLSIAVSNSPRSTVISGAPEALTAVLERLSADGVFCRPVKVDVASHSPQVDPLLNELREQLASIRPRSTDIAFRSTALGMVVDGADLGPDYWASNLRRPVMFGDAIAELAAHGAASFVEVSPHPILLPSIEQVLADVVDDDADRAGITLGSTRRGEPERAAMLGGLAALYEAGASVDWATITGQPSSHVSLPTYPWQRERHWYERRHRSARRTGSHPLLGHDVRPAADPGFVHWQTSLDGDDLGFLSDHVVQGSAVFPATGYGELARAAANVESDSAITITDLILHEALAVDADHPSDIQVESSPSSCRIYSRSRGVPTTGDDDPTWRLHAEMSVGKAEALTRSINLDEIRERCAEHRDADNHLAVMEARQLSYRGAFRTVADVWVGEGEALGRINGSETPLGSVAHRITVLDGCLQVGLAALPTSTEHATYVPVQIDRLTMHSFDDAAWSHAVITNLTPESARCDITVTDSDGTILLSCTGIEFQRVGSPDRRLGRLLFDLQWQPAELAPAPTDTNPLGAWVVYADGGVGDDVVTRLRSAGNHCIVVRPGASLTRVDSEFVIDPTNIDDHRAVAAAAHTVEGGCAGVVYAWAAAIRHDDVGRAENLGYLAPVAMIQAIPDSETPPRVWLVTCGALEEAPSQAVLWGFGRVAANEYPANAVTLIDLPVGQPDEQVLFAELAAGGPERQICHTDGVRRVARLRPAPVPRRELVRTAPTESFRLSATAPGSFESLRLRAQPLTSPGPDEVEVLVQAGALNFLDVLKAMGICPGIESTPAVALGAECGGVVARVGSNVDHVAVGDDVAAITSSYRTTSLLASHVTLPGNLVHKRPASMSAADVATVPVAYVTAYYSLHELARVRAGETVLIHSASGGVGLAAIELCRHLDVDVIATAGSDAKRAYLRSLGVEHVFDSRSTDFGPEVLAATGGRGVDVVLNSLVGEAISVGFSTLAAGGRFVEIGKRDVYAHSKLDMALFKRNIALFVVDLADLTEQDPSAVAKIFTDVMKLVIDGQLPPLPAQELPITEAAESFRTMARAGHIGKLVLTVPADPITADAPAVRDDATYLITGGLGGLGLAVAGRLAALGARYLVLLGRRAPGESAQQAIDTLRKQDVTVMTAAADVSDATGLGAALDAVRAEMPPIRGIVHAAGLLADATIATMDTERARGALAPKLHGTWNLHQATLGDPLDHFVLFSSVAGVLGLTGQSNYAAGNTYLDALATHRRSHGLPARSIQWGPWADIGLAAAADERGGRLDERGLAGLDPSDALDVFDLFLDAEGGDVAVMDLDPQRWASRESGAHSLVGELASTSTAEQPATRSVSLPDLLGALPPGSRRRKAMVDALREELAEVLRVDAGRIQRDLPLKAMGLDSLMALELRNRLEPLTGLTLSGTVAWNYPTVTLLSEHLAIRMEVPLDADEVAATEGEPTAVLAATEAVTSGEPADVEDLDALLAAELASIDRLLDTGSEES